MTMEESLYGLILAGGKSQRMGEDKAALYYEGDRQLKRVVNLVAPFVKEYYVSVRQKPELEDIRSAFPYIIDCAEMGGQGPASGIIAADRAYPQRNWLVVACDLPLLGEESLENLISIWKKTRSLDKAWEAWAYKSVHDGFSEPLCAIWSPIMIKRLEDSIKEGKPCPRRVLKYGKTLLLEAQDRMALENINTPEEREQILDYLSRKCLKRKCE